MGSRLVVQAGGTSPTAGAASSPPSPRPAPASAGAAAAAEKSKAGAGEFKASDDNLGVSPSANGSKDRGAGLRPGKDGKDVRGLSKGGSASQGRESPRNSKGVKSAGRGGGKTPETSL